MNGTMTWKAIVTFCTVCAVGLWGCGGGGGGATEYHRVIPDGYMEIGFSGGGVGNPSVQAGLGVLLDYTASGTGTGTAAGGPTSITDTADVDCMFTVPATTDGPEAYEILSGSTTPLESLCADGNACIRCAVPTTADTCSITCTGVVPSSAATAGESFDVTLMYLSTFTSDMPDPYGTIRFDAAVVGGDAYALSIIDAVPTFTDCAGTGEDLKIDTTEILHATWLPGGDTATEYRHGYNISDVGTAASSDCGVSHTFMKTLDLIGLDVGGIGLGADLGTVTMNSKICDDQNASAVAHGDSACAAGAP